MIKDWPLVIAAVLAFAVTMIALALSMLSVVDYYDAKLVVAACWGLAALVLALPGTKPGNDS